MVVIMVVVVVLLVVLVVAVLVAMVVLIPKAGRKWRLSVTVVTAMAVRRCQSVHAVSALTASVLEL